jgi:hypothetical protein
MSRQRTHCIYRKCAIPNYQELLKTVDDELVNFVVNKNFSGRFGNDEYVRSSTILDKPMKVPKHTGDKKDFPTVNTKVIDY